MLLAPLYACFAYNSQQAKTHGQDIRPFSHMSAKAVSKCTGNTARNGSNRYQSNASRKHKVVAK